MSVLLVSQAQVWSLMIPTKSNSNHRHSASSLACRDLNPRNILLTRHSDAKLGDTGLARLLVNQQPLTLYRATSSVVDKSLVCSPSYIDPEFQRTGTSSPVNDVYALGEPFHKSLPLLALAIRNCHCVRTCGHWLQASYCYSY